MKTHLATIACACLLTCPLASAQTAPAAPTASASPADADHEALRTLRTELVDAITKGDFDRVLASVHPDVVITWQNNEVCRGHAGLREFFNRMGKDAFKGYKTPPTPDGLTLLHGGDTGVSVGETVAAYNLLGSSYEMKSRWTATVVKQDDRWLLAGYHISMNVLDNPILTAAKGSLYGVGAAAAFAGLAAGFLFGRRRRA
jgi:ketosteroid isomerase-like protein